MGKVFDQIDDHLRAWVERQTMYFVGSAPLSADGHVNLSPKGPIGSLKVLGPRTVAYLEITGSGSETIAHLRENGRIVVMLCAFEGPPRIVRFHGTGEIVWPDDPRFEDLLAEAEFEDASVPEARRSIIVVHVTRVSDSCGVRRAADAVRGAAQSPRVVHQQKAPRARRGRLRRSAPNGEPREPRRLAGGRPRLIHPRIVARRM